MPKLKLLKHDDGTRMLNFAGECDRLFQQTLERKLAAEKEAKYKLHMDAALEVAGELAEAAKRLETGISYSVLQKEVVEILQEEGIGVEFDGIAYWVSFQPSTR